MSAQSSGRNGNQRTERRLGFGNTDRGPGGTDMGALATDYEGGRAAGVRVAVAFGPPFVDAKRRAGGTRNLGVAERCGDRDPADSIWAARLPDDVSTSIDRGQNGGLGRPTEWGSANPGS